MERRGLERKERRENDKRKQWRGRMSDRKREVRKKRKRVKKK